MIRILDTPKQWIPKNTFRYPPHQGLNPLIEERAFSYFTSMNISHLVHTLACGWLVSKIVPGEPSTIHVPRELAVPC